MEKSQALAEAERAREFRMAALAAPDQSQGDQGHQEGCKPPTVLQTYTVPLAAVKQNFDDWVGPIKAECHQLVTESGAVKPVTLQELEKNAGL